MYPIGLSLCGHTPTRELFEKFRQAGISHMEIMLGPEDDYQQVANLAREQSVNLWSFHLPFSPFSAIDISKPITVPYTLALLTTLIQKAAAIGIRYMVIHPSGEPVRQEERSERLAVAGESLCKLAEVAAREGVVIALEDLPRTCLGRDSNEILMLLGADHRLRVCFDTNHLLKENPVEFVRRVGSKIVTLHVSDYDRINERHWLPGEGVVDWQALLGALKAVDYDGPWLYEMGLRIPRTIHRDRELVHEDFVRNAYELFENRPFTRFSRPVDPLVIDEFDRRFTFE